MGVPSPSRIAFLRLVINPRICEHPESISDAWRQVRAWLGYERVWTAQPSERHAELLGEFLVLPGECRQSRIRQQEQSHRGRRQSAAPAREDPGVHVQLIGAVSATNESYLAERTQIKEQMSFSQEARAGVRMIMTNASRHGSANSVPRPHRDGRTSHTQSHRPVI